MTRKPRARGGDPGSPSRSAGAEAPPGGTGRPGPDPSPHPLRGQSLLDNLPGIAFRCRNQPEYPMEFISRGSLELTGYSPQELTGENALPFSVLILPEDQEDVWESVQQAVGKGQAYRITYRIVTKSGRIRWVLETGMGAPHDRRDPDYLEGFILDITDRVRTEDELRVQTAKLESLLSLVPEAIAVLDNSTRVVRINPEFTNLFGYTPEECIGNFLDDLIVPEELREEGRDLARKTFEGQRTKIETVRRRKDGTLVEVSLHTTTTEDDSGRPGVLVLYRDIGDRKKTERRLAETYQEMEAIFENSGVGIMLLKGKGFLAKANQRLADILGYGSAREMIGLSLRDLHLSARDHREFEEKYCRGLVRGAQTQIDYRLRKKNGDPVWCALAGKAIVSTRPPDLSKGVLWVLDDISGRKEAEEALRSSEARYRLLINQAPIGIVTLDTEGRILEVNQKCLDILGSPGAEETKKINVLSFPPMIESGISQDIRLCLEKGRNVVEERPYVSKWGIDRYIRYLVSPMRDLDDRIVGAQFILEDFTERRRAEEELRASENRNRAIFANAAVGMIVIDPKGRYQRVNEAWLEMIGYSAEELKSLTYLDLTHPEDKPASLELMERLTRGEIGSYQAENRFVKKDGTAFWLETAVSPIYDGQGDSEALVGVCVDISERKTAEGERIQREKLQGAIETAGAVCHELNQPLQALLGRVELLLLGTVGTSEKNHLESIEQEIHRMTEMTRKLQRITRYETSKYLEDSEILDLDKSVH